MLYDDSPDYLKSADLHNVGAGNSSFFSDPIGSIERGVNKVTDVVSAIPEWAAASVVSGGNSIYNSGVAAGNFFGITDATQQDTQELMTSLDSDLGKYYSANKQLVDTSGFIASSFVPGIAGVKIMNAGQKVLGVAMKSGAMGTTLADATGLIATVSGEGKTLSTIAGAALSEGEQTFTLMNAGVLKAIGAGVAQATIDSFAFETMVQATMFKSPLLEGQDFKDIASNIVTGTLLGGAIGGVIGSAKVYGDIKGAITARDLTTAPIRTRSSQAGFENSPSSRIVIGADDIVNTPTQVMENGALRDLNQSEITLAAKRISSIKLEQRTDIHALVDMPVSSEGERAYKASVGNYIADQVASMAGDDVANTFGGMNRITRGGSIMTPAEGEVIGRFQMHGEGAGDMSFSGIKDSQLTLADKFKSKDEIQRYVGSQKFSVNKEWKAPTANSMDEVEARYIWADELSKNKFTEGMSIHQSDIPLQEAALKNGITSVKITTESGESYLVNNVSDLVNDVKQNKLGLISDFTAGQKKGWGIGVGPEDSAAATTITNDEIARVANVSVKRIETDPDASLFARQEAQAAYDKMRVTNGLSTNGETNLSYVPKYANVAYDGSKLAGINGDTASAMVHVKYAQKLQIEATDRATAAVLGENNDKFFPLGDKLIASANRYGAGAGALTFANGSYNTLASAVESIGSMTAVVQKATKEATNAILDSPMLRLRSSQAAAIEWDKVNQAVASSAEKYILDPKGGGLIAKKTQDYLDAVNAGKKGMIEPELQSNAPQRIAIVNPDTMDAVTSHIVVNGDRQIKSGVIKNSLGLEDTKQSDAFYPIRPQPKEMPHFAFVKDPTITGSGMGHTSMLHAASESDLEEMIKMVQKDGRFAVHTKVETEEYKKAFQEYNWDNTLHDNYMDSSLKSMGINNQFFPKTDPNKIVDSIYAFHSHADDVLVRNAVTAKYAHEFDQLETLGQQYVGTASSRYGTTAKSIENTVVNPYNDYRKTALNISRLSEYPILTSVNRTLSDAVNGVYDKVSRVWDEAKSVNDLESVNQALKTAGINHAYANSAEIILANHTAPKPVLSQFIRGANAILSNTFLKLDPLNGLNNAVGAQVLLGTETSSALRGVLRESGITVPGTTDKIISAPAMIADANKAWFNVMQKTPESLALKERFQANGWMKTMNDQQSAMIDQLTLQGTENSAQMQGRLGKAMEIAKTLTDKAEIGTGNRFFEDYNRFTAAHVGDSIYSKGVQAGIYTEDGRSAYINTFVNRTQGNTLASQRPLLFQGPIGQAIGLFQTFQFNTMQQLFRHVAEGEGKDAAMMMGLQGTIYGMNGLPGFQYINQHIIGTASGNPNHTDAYSTLYGAAGKTAGDWLMYGVPSNLLQTNLYSRGDINPRTLTVVPVAPQDIVAVSAFGKFAGNMKDTFTKITDGGNVWQSLLQGVEHNGLSRPLAGLAQTLQAAGGSGKVISTTNKGDLSFANDFMSLATLSRLAGGKPMDEALANDEVARSQLYKASDKLRMNVATEVFKTSVIDRPDGEPVNPTAVTNYMQMFVHNGGRQQDFNQTMLHTMTQTNTPRANQIILSMKGPYGEHMKSLMNGKIADLLSSPE